MKIVVLCVAAVVALSPANAYVGSGTKLPIGTARTLQAGVCATSMSQSQEGKMGRRAALLTTLITGASVASKADAAGLNLMPPAFKDLKDGAAKRAGKEEAPAATGGKSLFEDKLKPPSFSVPKLGPQRKAKEASPDAEGDAPKEAPKPKGKVTGFSFGKKAKKAKQEDEDEEPEPAPKAKASKPAAEAPTKLPRKLKQTAARTHKRPTSGEGAGMSGKEEDRFKGGEIDSLEQKLLRKKSKADEQLQEIKSKVGEKDFDEVPNLNPFGGKK